MNFEWLDNFDEFSAELDKGIILHKGKKIDREGLRKMAEMSENILNSLVWQVLLSEIRKDAVATMFTAETEENRGKAKGIYLSVTLLQNKLAKIKNLKR